MADVNETWKVLPHGAVTEVDDGILTVTGELPMPFGRFPRRMTAVRLGDGTIAIYSAVALDAAGMVRIEAMGRPAVLIVPSEHHVMDARSWKQRYPDIRVLAPPGARESVEAAVAVDASEDVLGDPEVRLTVVPGTGEGESALEVRRGGRLTLIVNDVIGNVGPRGGFGARTMLRLMGLGVAGPQVPRTAKFLLIKNKAALAGQFRAWAEAPGLERILVSHGDAIEREPAAALRRLAVSLGA